MPTVDILALFIIVSFDFGQCTYNKYINFEEWFNLGKSAYLENDWKNCAEHFESALEAYHTFVNITLFCKNKCKNPKETLLFDNTDEELKFYEQKIRITLCLLNCKKSHKDYIEANDFVQKSILQDFENYEPYNYLQLCYFQVPLGKSTYIYSL